MAKRDPVEQRKRYLDRLKQQKAVDYRTFTSSRMYDAFVEQRGRESGSLSWTDRGENMLVCEWFVREQLLMRSGRPCREGKMFYPVAPQLTLDDDTTLVTLIYASEWTNYLVWRVGTGYGFRWLSEEEADTLSEWNHRVLRARLGLATRRRAD